MAVSRFTFSLRHATFSMLIITITFALCAELTRNARSLHVANEILMGLLLLGALAVFTTSFQEKSMHRDAFASSVMLLLLTFGQLLTFLLGDLRWHNTTNIVQVILSVPMIAIVVSLFEVSRQPDSPSHAIVHSDYIWLARFIMGIAAILTVACVLTVGIDDEIQRTVAKYTSVIAVILLALVFVAHRQLSMAQASVTLLYSARVLLGLVTVTAVLSALFVFVELAWGVEFALITSVLAVWAGVVLFYVKMFERYGELGINAYDGDEEAISASPTEALSSATPSSVATPSSSTPGSHAIDTYNAE